MQTARLSRAVAVAVAVALGNVSIAHGADLPSPKAVLGMDVGHDRVLASYAESERYLRALAAASPRVRLLELGKTVEGRTMIAVAISAPENLARLDELRRSWARVADPRGVAGAERARIIADTPSCALITAGIHANEVSGPQAALLLAHELAGAPAGSGAGRWLAHAVLLLVPSLNPDGQDAVVAWYRRWLGTPSEGAALPFLYHRYAGHDNNRDFVYLTQPESRALNSFVYRQWRPQLFLDLHQMGSTGPRQFVPPFADPIAPNVHPLVWRVTSHLGTLLAERLEEGGKSGVISGWTFDGNWIGGTRNTGWWKNVFGILTETASAALASPIEIDENELRGGGKGLVDYKPQVNFPNPWPGGRWGLSDAVSYQLVIMRAFLEFAATERESLLADVMTMAGAAVQRGVNEAPRGFVIPPDGDPARTGRLVSLLLEAGAEGFVAPDGGAADSAPFPAGSVVFPTAQPLRQYLAEVMGIQHYPEITPAPDAEILLPYDVTAWTMPLALGVRTIRADHELRGRLRRLGEEERWPAATVSGTGSTLQLPAGGLGTYAAVNRALARGAHAWLVAGAGSGADPGRGAGFIAVTDAPADLIADLRVDARRRSGVPAGAVPLSSVKVGVFQPNFGLEDGGWIRFVFEQAGFPVEILDPRAVRAGDLLKRVQVLALPPMEAKVLTEGPRQRGPAQPPPEFQIGIGKEGTEAIKQFFAQGGTVLAFGPSAVWLSETLDLPVTNTLATAKRDEVRSPGALLSVEVDANTAEGWGMPSETAAMVEGEVAFSTRAVLGDETRTVVARYPDRPLVLSGWMRGEEKLRRRAAVVEVRRGAGRAVLYAFAPYFRGQTEAVFPLLYNAVTAAMADRPRAVASLANK